jgi:hypothetical protein
MIQRRSLQVEEKFKLLPPSLTPKPDITLLGIACHSSRPNKVTAAF